MEPVKTVKRALTLADLLLLVAAAYIVAQLIFLAGPGDGGNLVIPVRPAGEPGSRAGTGPAADTRVILDRNLFDSRTGITTAGPLTETVAPEDLADLPDSTLPFVLLGTVVQRGGKGSFAVMQETSTRDQSIYHVGDEIVSGAFLVSVGRNRVIINRDGIEEVLERGEDEQGRVATARGARPRTASRIGRRAPQPETAGDITVRKVGDNSYVLDKREVDAVLQDFNKLLTQVRIVPHFSDGKPDGFKVFNIRPNSLFAKLGMVNGDIIRRINGLDITGPEQALQMFQQLREENRIALDMERFRKNLTLQYEIR